MGAVIINIVKNIEQYRKTLEDLSGEFSKNIITDQEIENLIIKDVYNELVKYLTEGKNEKINEYITENEHTVSQQYIEGYNQAVEDAIRRIYNWEY